MATAVPRGCLRVGLAFGGGAIIISPKKQPTRRLARGSTLPSLTMTINMDEGAGRSYLRDIKREADNSRLPYRFGA